MPKKEKRSDVATPSLLNMYERGEVVLPSFPIDTWMPDGISESK